MSKLTVHYGRVVSFLRMNMARPLTIPQVQKETGLDQRTLRKILQQMLRDRYTSLELKVMAESLTNYQ